jgi:hypothetical protein
VNQDDRKLWDLLGRSPRPSAPPFFAAKVMRQIEKAETRPSWIAVTLRWLAPAAVAAVVVFALLPRASAPVAVEYEPLTTLDIVEMVSPDDYVLLTSAGGVEDDDLLTSEL